MKPSERFGARCGSELAIRDNPREIPPKMKIKVFTEKEIFEAYTFSKNGDQALHLFGNPRMYPGAPVVFKKFDQAGHLFDMNLKRLMVTAKRFGVKCIFVHKKGTPKQHIDLCGKPLLDAIAWTEANK